MRRHTFLLLAGVGTLASSLAVSLALLDEGRATPACPADLDADVASMTIDAPAAIRAGEPLVVQVLLRDGSEAKRATVALLRADGPVTRTVELSDGYGAATFGPSVTAAAGHSWLFASACDMETSQPLQIRPGPATAPMEVLIGPRRITADGTSVASAVTIPIDGMGNPVADGTTVAYMLRRPGGELGSARVDTARLLGVLHVRAGTMAGSTTVAARVGSARGTVSELLEEPGSPAAGFPIRIEAAASGGRPISPPVVHVDDLRDGLGNVVADGALVSVVVTGGGTEGTQVQGTLIGGSARIPLTPMERSGTLTIQAFIDGVGSRILRHAVAPATSEARAIPLDVQVDPGLAGLHITVGPVLGDLGAYAADGTVATIAVVSPDGTLALERVALVDGVATRDLSALAKGTYRVHVSTIFGASTVETTLP